MNSSLTTNNSSLIGISGSVLGGYSGTSTATIATPYGLGIGIEPSTGYITIKNNQMRQVKVALFNVVRDPETNNITDSTFAEEFWVKQKADVSLELATMTHLKRLIDPDKEVIREIYSIYL
jgi:hypothetical protein